MTWDADSPLRRALHHFGRMAFEFDVQVFPLAADATPISTTLGDCRMARDVLLEDMEVHGSKPQTPYIRGDSTALLPCPFCGGLPEIINCEEPTNNEGIAVQCSKCLASSRVHFSTKDDAEPYVVSAWNDRVEPIVSTEKIGEIIHEMRQRHSSDDIATAVLVAIHLVETHETPKIPCPKCNGTGHLVITDRHTGVPIGDEPCPLCSREPHETPSGADTGSDVGAVAIILTCPICGRQPDIDECGPPTKETGPLGWYANCYAETPHEHNVGVIADTRLLVERAWNNEVGRVVRCKRRAALSKAAA